MFMKSQLKTASIVCLALLLSVSLFAQSAFAAYLPKDDPKSNHASNIALIYTGYYDPNNYDGVKVGDYDKDKFLPYVGYLNEEGKAEDYFFDTFLMLATQSPYKGSLHRWYDWVKDSKPGTLKDWQWAMDRMFIKNQQLDALNQAVKEVSKTLGDRNKTVNVYLTLPFPDPQSKDFGDFKGDGISANLESLETRNELVKWYIDTMTAKFYKQGYKYLKLAGFYWLQEDLDPAVPGEKENVKYAADYLNSKGMRLGWIPWSGAGEKANGNKYGFDFSLIQPNHFFQENTTIKRIEEIAKLAKENSQGVEIEFDLRAIEEPHYRQALYNYLIGGVKYGYMKDSILAYYQDVYAIYELYHHKSPVGRQFYTDIYKFAKGEFEPPTGSVDLRAIDFDGTPLAGATVSDESGVLGTTDENGRFRKDGLLSIEHNFTVSKDSFGSKSISLSIPMNETIYKDVALGTGKGETIVDTYTVGDFQGEFNVGGNTVVPRSFSTEKVHSGSQSLKVDFPSGWGPVRAFIDSSSDRLADSDREFVNYTNTDWSSYDTVAMTVYNDTDQEQKLVLEFMYDAYDWGSSKSKTVKLQPQQWNEVEIPLAELSAEGANLKNMIRMSLTMNEFNTSRATLYFDNITLRQYEKMKLAPDYAISLPSKVPTMDVGSEWTPTVVNRAVKNEQGQPTVASDVQFESTDPEVINVTDDGKLVARKAGKASIRAIVAGIEAESVTLEVSPWQFNKLKGGNSILELGKETTLTVQSFFENGYLIPAKDATYEWSIKKGKAIELVGEDNEQHRQVIKGVKNGKATVQVTISYNGKQKTFIKVIKVKKKP
ncbi:DUF4855 domain-containing protein [Numidum massiliense]|nr:DUF4855 domain-containing protein [Numidum massiliense]